MSRPLTIVTYHYVRNMAASAFPGIRGLTVDRFRGQLEYVQNHYQLVVAEQLLAALEDGGEALPPKAALLTFDDGYADHYANVLPVLQERGLKAAFFPPGRSVRERRVLDVHKVHFILASAGDTAALV